MAKKIEQKDALSWLVEKTQQQELKPDEFTTEMAHKRLVQEGSTRTIDALSKALLVMEKAGQLTKRKILVKTNYVCVWKRVV